MGLNKSWNRILLISYRNGVTLFLACSAHRGSSYEMSRTGVEHCVLSENLAVQYSNNTCSELNIMWMMHCLVQGRAGLEHFFISHIFGEMIPLQFVLYSLFNNGETFLIKLSDILNTTFGFPTSLLVNWWMCLLNSCLVISIFSSLDLSSNLNFWKLIYPKTNIKNRFFLAYLKSCTKPMLLVIIVDIVV